MVYIESGTTTFPALCTYFGPCAYAINSLWVRYYSYLTIYRASTLNRFYSRSNSAARSLTNTLCNFWLPVLDSNQPYFRLTAERARLEC